MPQTRFVLRKAFEHGLRFDPETCTLINHYPGEAPVVDEPEEPPAPQPDADGDAGDLSCAARGCKCLVSLVAMGGFEPPTPAL